MTSSSPARPLLAARLFAITLAALAVGTSASAERQPAHLVDIQKRSVQWFDRYLRAATAGRVP
jgi:hypothetical protein